MAEMIGENRSPEAKLEEAYGKNAEQALMVDRLALKLSLATTKLDEALTKIAKQEEIIREVTGSKAKAERILEYYDNAHTSPRNRTITRREINKQKKGERKMKNSTGRRGRRKGCTNTAVSRKATKTVVHRPDRCKSCGGQPRGGAHRQRTCGGHTIHTADLGHQPPPRHVQVPRLRQDHHPFLDGPGPRYPAGTQTSSG